MGCEPRTTEHLPGGSNNDGTHNHGSHNCCLCHLTHQHHPSFVCPSTDSTASVDTTYLLRLFRGRCRNSRCDLDLLWCRIGNEVENRLRYHSPFLGLRSPHLQIRYGDNSRKVINPIKEQSCRVISS